MGFVRRTLTQGKRHHCHRTLHGRGRSRHPASDGGLQLQHPNLQQRVPTAKRGSIIVWRTEHHTRTGIQLPLDLQSRSDVHEYDRRSLGPVLRERHDLQLIHQRTTRYGHNPGGWNTGQHTREPFELKQLNHECFERDFQLRHTPLTQPRSQQYRHALRELHKAALQDGEAVGEVVH